LSKGEAKANTVTLEVYADSLFQASIDSVQIAGGAILVFKKVKCC
jgi:small neutral amino acid transporter SnatA (MarC family)